MSALKGSYSEGDAQEIIRRAASLQGSGALSKAELLKAAAELGITPEAVEEAERQYESAKAEEELETQFRAKRRHDFFDSFKVLIACSLISYLLAMKFLSSPRDAGEIPWAAAIVAAFGIWSVVKNGARAFSEGSVGWKKGFEEFKAADQRRKARSTLHTNDRLISEILASTRPDDKQDVIHNLRETTGLSQDQASSAVDDYYQRHPELRQSASG